MWLKLGINPNIETISKEVGIIGNATTRNLGDPILTS